MTSEAAITEQQKYEEMWSYPAYSKYSPAEAMLPMFRQMVRKRGRLVDIGCGTARATKKLEEDGWQVTGVDFVDARETDVDFFQMDITEPWLCDYQAFDMGYCCDVLEHIPPVDVDMALANIMAHCERAFLSIHFGEDHFGQVVGHPLHLTIRPFEWWVMKLAEHSVLVQARDLIGEGLFLVRRR